MKSFAISESAVSFHYEVLDKIGCLGSEASSGFLRAAYSDEETGAMEYIERCAVAIGAQAAWDAAGNLALSWPGAGPEFVETGSHLDTVPNAGNHDGVAGVVAGLLAIETLLKSELSLTAGLRLRIWRAEESGTFNSGTTGSLAAVGKLDSGRLSNRFNGITLADAMQNQGAKPELVRAQRPTISQRELDLIRAHLELHIEQGNFLEIQKIDLGIVTSIRAPRRYRILLRGEFDHSGATPMGIEFRRDANLALAHILVGLDELCGARVSQGADLVQTIGVINSSRDFNERNDEIYGNAISKVSGLAYFSFEVRSSNKGTLEDYSKAAEKLIAELAAEFNVSVQIDFLGTAEPLEQLDLAVQDALESSA